MRTSLMLIVATALWGLNFHLGKMMIQESSAIVAGFWRYFLGATALLLFSLRNLPKWEDIKEHGLALAFVGFVGLFGFNFFFFVGIKHTSAVNAALIMGLNPTLTVLFSFFILKTKILPSQVVGLIIAFLGVIFLISKGQLLELGLLETSIGDVYIFLANVVFALHHVLVKKYHGRMPIMHFTLSTNVICLLLFALILPFQESEAFADYSSNYWISSIGIGVFGTALGYFLWNKGVGTIGADRAGIYMNVVPLAAVLLSFFFGEQLFIYHLYSFVIIVTGVVVMQLKVKF